jgi:precorrin-3B synthase
VGLTIEQAILPARAFDISDVIGHREVDGAHYVGVALPFGRLSGDALDHLADTAARHGASELRLTPWRAILIAGISSQAADAIVAELRGERFILDANDPRLHVAACSGAPACASATTPVQQDAERFSRIFAQSAPAGTALHVSGCAKGCAHPSSAPFTLVGHDGHYDLIENGSAADHPVAVHLSPDEVEAELLRRLRPSKEFSLVQLS